MSGIAWAPIHAEPESLMVLDTERRLYAALRSDGKAYHLVQPAGLDDPRVGDGKVRAGELVCSGCPGGMFRADVGSCWAVKAALMFEGRDRDAIVAANRRRPVLDSRPGDHEDRIPWLDSPAGAGETVEAFRG